MIPSLIAQARAAVRRTGPGRRPLFLDDHVHLRNAGHHGLSLFCTLRRVHTGPCRLLLCAGETAPARWRITPVAGGIRIQHPAPCPRPRPDTGTPEDGPGPWSTFTVGDAYMLADPQGRFLGCRVLPEVTTYDLPADLPAAEASILYSRFCWWIVPAGDESSTHAPPEEAP